MRAIIFDMDGVIIDSNPPHKIALKQFCLKYGHNLSEDELRTKVYGRTNKDWLKSVFGELLPEQIAEYGAEKESLYRKIYAPDIAPVAGIVSFIQALHEAKNPKAIATSAPAENVSFTLKHTKLEGYFSTILDESFVEIGKPHPDIYLKTAKALGFEPSNCIVFEDSLAGVQAAKSAGCTVIGISTTHTVEELRDTSLVISHFLDLQMLMNWIK